jgi:hypothetical protein
MTPARPETIEFLECRMSYMRNRTGNETKPQPADSDDDRKARVISETLERLKARASA